MLAVGHSAGGHLAAMLLATDWRALDPGLPADLVPAALPISGVFELEPLLRDHHRAGAAPDAGRGARAVAALAALARPAVHCVVGGDESGEYYRQTRDIAAAWGASWEARRARTTSPCSPRWPILTARWSPARNGLRRGDVLRLKISAGDEGASP